MFTRNALFVVLIPLYTAMLLNAQSKGTIVYTLVMNDVKIDPETGEWPDMPIIYALEDAGYEVIKFYNASLSTAEQATLDTLYNANLIVLGRSTPSLDYAGDNKEIWNAITTPIINLEMWSVRSSRLNWFNTTNMLSVTEEGTVYNAIIEEPNDPVFDGVDNADLLPWVVAPFDAIGTTDAGYGSVLAWLETDNTVLFVRFEPDVEFYFGSVDYPAGPRTLIGNGRDVSGAAPFTYYNFTPEAEQVFLAEVARMVALGGGGTVVEDREKSMPSAFRLSQNYPNPFNPSTVIPFDLPEKSHVRLSLTNILGKEIREIVNREFNAGHHEVALDAGDLAAGIYFYQIVTETNTAVAKLAVVK